MNSSYERKEIVYVENGVENIKISHILFSDYATTSFSHNYEVAS